MSVTSHSSHCAPLYGLLLAGGESRRMGRNKALLALDGQGLLARGLALLTAAGCQRCFVSGQYPGLPCLPDAPAWQGLGPLSGMASAALAYPLAHWLVLPVDMPGLAPADLQALILAAGDGPGACYQPTQFPLLLRAGPRRAALLAALLADPEPRARRVGALLKGLGLPALPAEPQSRFLNTNTPAQWQELLQTLGSTDTSAPLVGAEAHSLSSDKELP